MTLLGVLLVLVGLFFTCILFIPLIFSFNSTVAVVFIISLITLISGVWLLKSSRYQTQGKPVSQPTTSQRLGQQPQQGQSSGCMTNLLVISIIVIVGGAAIMLVLAIDYFSNRSNYNKGHQAYQEANCTVAVDYFNRIIERSRLFDIGGYVALARQEKGECLPQLAIDKQKAGDFNGALLTYVELVSDYSGSVSVESIRSGIASLFEQAEPSTLANLEVCNKMDILLGNNLIPERDTNLPPLYFICGQLYKDNQDHTNAKRMYENFLSNYPNHPLASDVKIALTEVKATLATAEAATAEAKVVAEAATAEAKVVLARSTIAEAKAAGAGNLPPLEPAGVPATALRWLLSRTTRPISCRLYLAALKGVLKSWRRVPLAKPTLEVVALAFYVVCKRLVEGTPSNPVSMMFL